MSLMSFLHVSMTAGCVFPLASVPKLSYKTGGRGFGAARPFLGKQLHGACDLIAPVGTEIFAVDNGVVVNGPYYFWNHTYAIEIKHPLFIGRYCEILKDVPVKMGDYVEKGQVIAKVGQMGTYSMLHFEMFSGAAHGGLTNGKLPYKRRSDLLDPTPYLDLWKANLPKGNDS